MEHHKGCLTAFDHTYNTKINVTIKSRTRTGSRPKLTHLVAAILYEDKNISKLYSV